MFVPKEKRRWLSACRGSGNENECKTAMDVECRVSQLMNNIENSYEVQSAQSTNKLTKRMNKKKINERRTLRTLSSWLVVSRIWINMHKMTTAALIKLVKFSGCAHCTLNNIAHSNKMAHFIQYSGTPWPIFSRFKWHDNWKWPVDMEPPHQWIFYMYIIRCTHRGIKVYWVRHFTVKIRYR